jgi:hypothetical protein
MSVNQTQDIKEAIKISLDNFTQNFASHYLNRMKEVGEAVSNVVKESLNIVCPWCGWAAQVKDTVNILT